MEQQTLRGRLAPNPPPPPPTQIKDEPAQKITNHENHVSLLTYYTVEMML